jgi:hypothetical protein
MTPGGEQCGLDAPAAVDGRGCEAGELRHAVGDEDVPLRRGLPRVAGTCARA